MSYYYIVTKQNDFDMFYENLSVMLPPDTVSVSHRLDNNDIMPAKYICLYTELLSDAGMLHMVKQITDVYCKDKKFKIVKELEGRNALV